MIFLRSALFAVTFYASTFVLTLLCLPGLVLPYRVALFFEQKWLAAMLKVVAWTVGITVEWRGEGNIPDGPVILAAKHQSAWDTIELTRRHPEAVLVLKRELTWIPVWGWYLKRLGMIPIDRAKGVSALKNIAAAATRARAAGRSVLIFPQGTRTPPGAVRPYLPGVAAIYTQLRVPVVPIALNSGLFWPRRRFMKWPGIVTVEYLEPIPPGLDRKTFMNTLAERIDPATARLEAEALQRFPWLPPIPPPEDAGAAPATAAEP